MILYFNATDRVSFDFAPMYDIYSWWPVHTHGKHDAIHGTCSCRVYVYIRIDRQAGRQAMRSGFQAYMGISRQTVRTCSVEESGGRATGERVRVSRVRVP